MLTELQHQLGARPFGSSSGSCARRRSAARPSLAGASPRCAPPRFIAIAASCSPGTELLRLHRRPPAPGPGPRCAVAEPRRCRPARAWSCCSKRRRAADPAGGGGSQRRDLAGRRRSPETLPPPPIPAPSASIRRTSSPARPAARKPTISSTIETARSTPRRPPWRSSPTRWACLHRDPRRRSMRTTACLRSLRRPRRAAATPSRPTHQAVPRLAREGVGMDVVSGGELARALAAGACAWKKSSFCVGKTREDVVALDAGNLGVQRRTSLNEAVEAAVRPGARARRCAPTRMSMLAPISNFTASAETNRRAAVRGAGSHALRRQAQGPPAGRDVQIGSSDRPRALDEVARARELCATCAPTGTTMFIGGGLDPYRDGDDRSPTIRNTPAIASHFRCGRSASGAGAGRLDRRKTPAYWSCAPSMWSMVMRTFVIRRRRHERCHPFDALRRLARHHPGAPEPASEKDRRRRRRTCLPDRADILPMDARSWSRAAVNCSAC